MQIAVLGTGMVGQAHAAKLSELGHEVFIGTRDVQKSLAKAKPGQITEPFGEWVKQHPKVKVVEFLEAVKHGDLVIEALSGNAVVETLKSIEKKLIGKTLIDISNPLVFSNGELTLTVCNDDSLGEQVQRALPDVKVVKAFNTVNASVQVNPESVASGDHHLFIAGDHMESKYFVNEIAKEWYGWKNVIDLGDIKSSRGMEMIMPLWMNLFRVMGSPKFNFKVTQWDSAVSN
jgi:8-hydroxy-5-deazaflavin:NADPH oxidoreductase